MEEFMKAPRAVIVNWIGYEASPSRAGLSIDSSGNLYMLETTTLVNA
jgi:hypothetical protein